MVADGEYKNDAAKAVSFKDGPSSIDLKSRVEAKAAIAKAAAANYDKAKIAYMFGDGSIGMAIVGPYGGVGTDDSLI